MSSRIALQYVSYSIAESILPRKFLSLDEYENIIKGRPKSFDLQEEYELLRLQQDSSNLSLGICNGISKDSSDGIASSSVYHQNKDTDDVQAVRRSLVESMMAATSLPADTCQQYLELVQWDVHKAVNAYFESK